MMTTNHHTNGNGVDHLPDINDVRTHVYEQSLSKCKGLYIAVIKFIYVVPLQMMFLHRDYSINAESKRAKVQGWGK